MEKMSVGKVLLLTVLFPFILLYNLVANHFDYYMTYKAIVYENILGITAVWKNLFGIEVNDYSLKVADYDLYARAKQCGISKEVAHAFRKKFSRLGVSFLKKKKEMFYIDDCQQVVVKASGKKNHYNIIVEKFSRMTGKREVFEYLEQNEGQTAWTIKKVDKHGA